ncbi:MAG: VWA domain-containing protein, partial [Myxococcales bacterium]|nr:VWA domain-containing protein [Myxococcales bacterium]
MNTFHKHLGTGLAALALTALVACGDDGSYGSGGSDGSFGDSGGDQDPGVGVGQGGAQDFGQFRQILEDGGIPGPEVLDDVGFFNEHKIEMPAADCGENVCLHGLFGRMGNMISGSDCNIVLLGMNTPINPDELERPPLNLAIAIDTSGSMKGDPMDYTVEGLVRMLDALEPGDYISLVAFSDVATVVADHLAHDDPALDQAIASLYASGSTNVYDGLRSAYDLVGEHAAPELQNRVILLSDGVATAGITNDDKALNLATSWADAGVGLTTIGVGTDFDVELMRDLSETGAGAFYFLENPAAVQEVFIEEVTSFLVPLAEELHIDIDINNADYRLRGIYGTKLFEFSGAGADIDIPTVQIAHRTSPSDNDNGRRGGGGAIVVELLEASSPSGDGSSVGQLDLRYRDPATQQLVEQSVPINSPLTFDSPDFYFESASAEKGFVTLNVFVGFHMAASRAAVGDGRGA